MKRISFVTLTILMLCLFSNCVHADCSNDELIMIKSEIKKIIISYKHLGEVVKEDGSKVYNEFMVTAKNMPEDVYIYLYPMTSEKFEVNNNDASIRLTTGIWNYDLYSSKCEKVVDTITVKLPTFNIYSLDPLCEGVDGDEFILCGKYYEGTVSREDFELRVNNYRRLHIKEEQDDNVDNANIFDVILNFIKAYYIYIILIISVGLICLLVINIISKKKNKRVLQ